MLIVGMVGALAALGAVAKHMPVAAIVYGAAAQARRGTDPATRARPVAPPWWRHTSASAVR